jgi:hypothetical protein
VLRSQARNLPQARQLQALHRTFVADWFEKRALDIFSKTTDHYFFFFQGLAQTGKSKVG